MSNRLHAFMFTRESSFSCAGDARPTSNLLWHLLSLPVTRRSSAATTFRPGSACRLEGTLEASVCRFDHSSNSSDLLWALSYRPPTRRQGNRRLATSQTTSQVATRSTSRCWRPEGTRRSSCTNLCSFLRPHHLLVCPSVCLHCRLQTYQKSESSVNVK